MNALYLAWAHLRYHWGRSLVLALAVGLILFVPLATRLLLDAGERGLTARSEATPLLLGRRGSALDLTLAALYFSDERPDPLPMSEVDSVWDSGLALPIPLHTGFTAEGFRIVGTSLDYFDFRGLHLAEGRGLALLGEAVLGAEVAARLGKRPGDTIVSAPGSLFDLDGVYPLEMSVVGVLDRNNSPDDAAVFVDIKTAWVIEGIGHGHEDVVTDAAEAANAIARADIVEFQRITPENIESFHFHGDGDGFPVTAAIVVPNDTRAGTILEGRYLDPAAPAQLLRPAAVVGGLIERIFRIRALLDVVSAISAFAALAAIGLALLLSYRLRAPEVATAQKLGARRGRIVGLVALESLALVILSGIVATATAALTAQQADAWVKLLLAI